MGFKRFLPRYSEPSQVLQAFPSASISRKVTIGPDGTIHVDDDNHKAAESVPTAPDKGKSNGTKTTSQSNRADSAKYNGSKQAGRSSHKQKPAPASQEATKAPDKESTGWLSTLVGGILTILLIGGVCAGIGILVMSGLGIIPLIAFIGIVIICALAGSGKKS